MISSPTVELGQLVSYVRFGGHDSFVMDTPASWRVDKHALSVFICTICGGIGSEFMQSILSGGKRKFDPRDILCNIVGSLVGIAASYFNIL